MAHSSRSRRRAQIEDLADLAARWSTCVVHGDRANSDKLFAELRSMRIDIQSRAGDHGLECFRAALRLTLDPEAKVLLATWLLHLDEAAGLEALQQVMDDRSVDSVIRYTAEIAIRKWKAASPDFER